jgi:hypothetical protein
MFREFDNRSGSAFIDAGIRMNVLKAYVTVGLKADGSRFISPMIKDGLPIL